MANAIILNLYTITLYFYIYYSVYSFSDFAKLRKNGYLILAMSMVLHSVIIVSAYFFKTEQYVSFFSMLIVMWLTFYFALDTTKEIAAFAAVRHVFYFMSFRGITVSIYSIFTKVPIRDIEIGSRNYIYLFQLAAMFAIGFNYFLRKYYLTNNRLSKLLANRSQVVFVTSVKFAMGCYLMFNAYSSRYTTDSWYAIVHLVTSLLVIGVAEFGLMNSVRISEMLEYEKQTVALKKQLDLQVNHYKSYQKYTLSFREFRHDYKRTLSSINALLRNNEYEKAIRLLDDVGAHLTHGVEAHREYSNDVFIDAILQAFVNQCHENNIDFRGVVYWDDNIEIEDFKVVRVFNNLLENAFEAVMKLEPDQRFIEIKTHVRDFWLDIEIKNPFNGVVNSELATTKDADRSSHGLGTKIVEQTMEEIGGLVSYIPNEKLFTVRLNFPTYKSKGA